MTRRILVACVGNIFFGDDGFGSEVARRLGEEDLPEEASVVDFGIGGVHLAYELVDGWDLVVIVDAVSRGDPPGTVTVIDAGEASSSEGVGTLAAMDAHGMDPAAVLGMAGDLGARLGRVLIVGCEAQSAEEGMGLSSPVAAAVEPALRSIIRLVSDDSFIPPDKEPCP